jgi:hypothetical protein
MSSLKEAAPELVSASNNRDMSVTLDVSHIEMWRHDVSAVALSESHAATAVLMVSSSTLSTSH